ncbi:DDE-type integrase/transposase/recombinase, partial [Ferrimicrobium acidiphilum]|uniref:DDE-type integrase/transposase/recombinase n=1 Tax=Ferrimicrobium acidiphilum TaxID=121039 RepID=UPI0023F3403B
EAYDLYQSYNQAARECHCSPNTVKALVQARKDGTLAARGRRQSTSSIFNADELSLITELVEASEGFIRADVIHRRLQGIGYKGSGRSTRRAVRKEKTKYRRAHARVYWPWIPEPGKWAQYDFSDGPVIDGEKTTLFHYYLPYSKYRIVLYIPDQSLPNVIGALHTCFAMTGGVPHYVLTDNAKTAASAHIANVAVLNAKMVKFASAYGFALQTCIPYDPASKGGVSYCTFWVGSDTKATTSLIEWPSHQRVASIYEVCGGGHPHAIRHSALLPPRLAQPWLLAHHMMGSILLSRLGA